MHPSFIRGFVKQCYDNGLSEEQAEAALKAWGLREQLEDPDFRAGFDKEASTLQRLMQGWDSLGRTGQGAVVGGGAGALAGLIGGGKNKLRNMLFGGGAGAGLGALGGHYLGSRAGGAEVNNPAMHGDFLAKSTGAPEKAKALKELKGELDTGANSFKGDVSGTAPFVGSVGKTDTTLKQPVVTTSKQKLTAEPLRSGALRAFGTEYGNQKDIALAALRKLKEQTGSSVGQGMFSTAGDVIGAGASGAAEGLSDVALAPVNAAKAVGSEAKRVGTALSEGVDRAWKQQKEDRAARELAKLRGGL